MIVAEGCLRNGNRRGPGGLIRGGRPRSGLLSVSLGYTLSHAAEALGLRDDGVSDVAWNRSGRQLAWIHGGRIWVWTAGDEGLPLPRATLGTDC